MKNKKKVFIKLFLIVLLFSVNCLCISCSNKIKSEDQTIKISELDKKNIMNINYNAEYPSLSYTEFIYYGLWNSYKVPVIVDVDFNNCYFICCYITNEDYAKLGYDVTNGNLAEFYDLCIWKKFNSQEEIEKYEDMVLGRIIVVGNAKIVKNVLTDEIYNIEIPIYMPIEYGCYFKKLPIDTNGFSYYTSYNFDENYLCLKNFKSSLCQLKLLKLDGEYYFDIFYRKKQNYKIEELDEKEIENTKYSILFLNYLGYDFSKQLSFIQDYFSIYEKKEEFCFIGNVEIVCTSIYNTLFK